MAENGVEWFSIAIRKQPVYSLSTMRKQYSHARIRTPDYKKFEARAKRTGAKVIEAMGAAAVLVEEATDEQFIRALRLVRESGMEQPAAADAA